MSFFCPLQVPSPLLGGTLHLRYCAARFASKVLTWRLLLSGRVVDLLTAGAEVGIVRIQPCVRDVMGGRW